MQTEVTYELWQAVYNWATDTARGANRYSFDNAGRQGGEGTGTAAVGTNKHPVTTINWYDAMKFSNALTEYYNATNGSAYDLSLAYGADAATQQTIRTVTYITASETTYIFNTVTPNANATGFALPLHSEWELAARFIRDSSNDGDIMDSGEYYPGGYASGATSTTSSEIAAVAWYNGKSTTNAVAQMRENALGLYDMSGNVWEWCFDLKKGVAKGVPVTRLIRSGSYDGRAGSLKVGHKGSFRLPEYENHTIGLRLTRH